MARLQLWVLASLASLLHASAIETCPNMCSGHGECDRADVVCSCFKDYRAGDCSYKCSNRGTCDDPAGECRCQDGYEGRACERTVCPNDCSGNGICMSMHRLAEHSRYYDGSFPYNLWDAHKVYGCVCDPGSEGYDCAKQTCPMGDDPMTDGQVDEIQLVKCVASGGSFRLRIDGRTTVPISATATDLSVVKAALEPIVGDVSVTYSVQDIANPDSDSHVCEDSDSSTEDGAVWAVTFLQRHGDVPELRLAWDLSQTLEGTAPSITVFSDGESYTHPASGPAADQRLLTSVKTTKEWLPCSGRGVCDYETGDCKCFQGFTSSNGRRAPGNHGDCGWDDDPITSCPAAGVNQLECNGHGRCSDHGEYTCDCYPGWMGGACSERTCPSGLSWFEPPSADNVAHLSEKECSDRGHCNRVTGTCDCMPGYTGSACERTQCPLDKDTSEECSGHGTCKSMHELAKLHQENGVPVTVRYGTLSQTTEATVAYWDDTRMYGCACEEGWEGFDCNRRSCPRGDDPKTPGVPEVQVLHCNATGATGSFTLTFRGETTESIERDADLATLKAALEELDTISDVTVTSDGTTVCADPVTPLQITFGLELGDLPSMLPVATGLNGVVQIFTDGSEGSVKGTRENAECSNRGICNYDTGECECFMAYGPSSGFANEKGDKRDCGWYMPVQPWSGTVRDKVEDWRNKKDFINY